MNKTVLQIPLGLIDIGERLRPVDPDWVALIAASMKERGQDTPIRVTPGDQHGRHRLIAGAHRLEAARLAGLAKIDAIVFEGNELQAELLQIDENLVRRELSDLDRAVFLARRKEVWEALHPETKKAGNQGLGPQGQFGPTAVASFTKEAAAKLGLSETTIKRAVARYTHIAPDVRERLATTRFADKGSELDALARLAPAEQRAVVALLLREDDRPRHQPGPLHRSLARDPRPPAA